MDHINNELPVCPVITEDLHARCSKWCNKNITNLVGRETDTLTKWDYSCASTENIQKTVWNFDWKKAFGNLFVNRKVDLVNETLLNIFKNYIPSKEIKFNYCQPPWMNGNIKRCFKERSTLTNYFITMVKKGKTKKS